LDNLLNELQDIFRNVFDRPDLMISRESSASTVDDWDSLTHVNLITVISMKYKIRFALGELGDLKNVGELMDLIQRKLAAK
jgi:acyl carrier protein